MKFLWALAQSGVVSATRRLNKLSRDYRYVAQCLAAETLFLKVKEIYIEICLRIFITKLTIFLLKFEI